MNQPEFYCAPCEITFTPFGETRGKVCPLCQSSAELIERQLPCTCGEIAGEKHCTCGDE